MYVCEDDLIDLLQPNSAADPAAAIRRTQYRCGRAGELLRVCMAGGIANSPREQYGIVVS